ncbi:MAG: hypothetical protein F6J92_41440 [Symploca sp. SIO1A3]|nr:hypothetical protein [Symploca sp. SIO2C1]NER52996.1 hypothetical protein [Symploca sp. SIO1A3]
MPATIYQPSKAVSSAIISIDYQPKQFLSFDVIEASKGHIVWSENKATALECQIRDTTYTFNRKHLEIMSKSERHILYGHLGVDGNKLEATLA